MLVLLGIAVIVAGFLLRFNPLVVVVLSALVTALAAWFTIGLAPLKVFAAFGHAFNTNRIVTIIYIVLPVIGLLERHGLQERARMLIASIRGATAGRLLIVYLLFRQLTAAIGLTSIAGPAQSVRPLVAPMAIAAAEKQGEPEGGDRIPAMAAATDTVGLFFGEDIFLAIGSILLMKGILDGYGLTVQPFDLSVWAIPTAVAAFAIHGARLWWLDRKLAKQR